MSLPLQGTQLLQRMLIVIQNSRSRKGTRGEAALEP